MIFATLALTFFLILPNIYYTDIETQIHSRDFFIYPTESSYIRYCVKTAKDFITRDSTITKIVLRFEASWQPRIGHWAKEERVNCTFYIYKRKHFLQSKHYGTGK